MLPQETDPLSERERGILILVATGASNKEIGLRLFISTNTVKVHLRNIFAKIGVSTRTEAALYAIRTGLIRSPEVESTSAAAAIIESDSLAVTNEPKSGEYPKESDPLAQAAEPVPARPRTVVTRRIALWLTGLSILALSALVIFRYDLLTMFLDPKITVSAEISTPVATIQWRETSSIPVPLTGLAACSEQSKVYVFGGATTDGTLNASTYLFNSTQNSWEVLADKPTPVRDAQAVLLGKKIYIPGGATANGQPTDQMEIYDPISNSWSVGTPLPEPRSAYGLIAFEGRLYLFGGWDGWQTRNTLFIFDPGLQTWQAGPPMPTQRAYISAALQGSSIFVMGGERDPQTALNTVEIYEPGLEGGNWRDGPALPYPRTAASAITLADTIYLVGGATSASETAADLPIMLLTPEMNWGLLNTSTNQNRSHLASVTIGPAIVAIGGSQAGRASAQVDQLQILYTTSVPLIIR